MIEIIQQTAAFKALSILSQGLAIRRENRLKIEDAIIQARTMGLKIWFDNSQLNPNWKSIVKEIIENE